MKSLLLSFWLVFLFAISAFAGMSANNITATKTGISDAMSLFYTIGGSILVVCAAIWGFKRVKALLCGDGGNGSEKGSPEYYQARNDYNNSKRDSFSRWKQSNHE